MADELARRQRQGAGVAAAQRAAVDVDDGTEVRRLRAELRQRVRDEALLVGLGEHGVVRALEADRRRDLQIHAGAAAHRSAEVAGPDLGVVGQREEALVQRAEDAARPVGGLDREVGTGDVADEHAVAGEHRPRPVGVAAAVEQGKGGVLGAVARRVERADAHVAQRELPAVLERLVLVRRAGPAVHGGRGARRGAQAPVPRDGVGGGAGGGAAGPPGGGGGGGGGGVGSGGWGAPGRTRGGWGWGGPSFWEPPPAATPARSSPIRYEAQPRSSWMSWRKITASADSLTS